MATKGSHRKRNRKLEVHILSASTKRMEKPDIGKAIYSKTSINWGKVSKCSRLQGTFLIKTTTLVLPCYHKTSKQTNKETKPSLVFFDWNSPCVYHPLRDSGICLHPSPSRGTKLKTLSYTLQVVFTYLIRAIIFQWNTFCKPPLQVTICFNFIILGMEVEQFWASDFSKNRTRTDESAQQASLDLRSKPLGDSCCRSDGLMSLYKHLFLLLGASVIMKGERPRSPSGTHILFLN